MDQLSEESRNLYDLIRMENTADYEARFLDYQKRTLDEVRKFVLDTGKQVKAVSDAVESVKASAAADLETLKVSIGADLKTVNDSLSYEIKALAAALARVPRPDPGASADRVAGSSFRAADDGTASQGHHSALPHRGPTFVHQSSSPVGGNNFGRLSHTEFGTAHVQNTNPDAYSSGYRAGLPQFDGSNPKLWQIRCEEYFDRWQT
jgi:hypothetical protein